jgi:hypothetical protein
MCAATFSLFVLCIRKACARKDVYVRGCVYACMCVCRWVGRKGPLNDDRELLEHNPWQLAARLCGDNELMLIKLTHATDLWSSSSAVQLRPRISVKSPIDATPLLPFLLLPMLLSETQ